MLGDTSLSLCNRALAEIGQQVAVSAPVPSATDGSAAGGYCATLYGGLVRALLRQGDYSFAQKTALLTPAVGVSPPPQWTQVYAYPTDCIRLRQVFLAPTNPFKPQPTRWVAAEYDTGTPTRCIFASVQAAYAVYTGQPPESQWDSIFVEDVVRFLGSGLSMALAGRPDFAKAMFEQVEAFTGSAIERDDA